VAKDWTGNKNSIYKILGASNHTDKERQEHDYYATEPRAIDLLLEVEEFNKDIWECAAGEGHLSKRLIAYGYNVKSTDLIDRGYGEGGVDFLKQTEWFDGDIITNPPYRYAIEFVYKALELIPTGNKVAMFLKLQFLESKKRRKLFDEYPPKVIYVSSSRLLCAKNGDFEGMKKDGGSAVAYAWFIWEKGYTGETIVRWIN
jgi:hypothetical protein